MKNLKKGFTLIELIVIIAIVGMILSLALSIISQPKRASACGIFTDCNPPSSNSTQLKDLTDNQARLVTAVPLPTLTNSLERQNISKRAQLFDKPDKISYIYLVSFGKVMAFYTVKGKVSSLNSFMSPQEQLVKYNGSPCDFNHSSECYAASAPDIDGSYGVNVDGIFFFTTEGAYVEWKGDYMMSDQPLQLSTQPELIRTIK